MKRKVWLSILSVCVLLTASEGFCLNAMQSKNKGFDVSGLSKSSSKPQKVVPTQQVYTPPTQQVYKPRSQVNFNQNSVVPPTQPNNSSQGKEIVLASSVNQTPASTQLVQRKPSAKKPEQGIEPQEIVLAPSVNQTPAKKPEQEIAPVAPQKSIQKQSFEEVFSLLDDDQKRELMNLVRMATSRPATPDQVKEFFLQGPYEFIWDHTWAVGSALGLGACELARHFFDFALRELGRGSRYDPVNWKDVVWWQSAVIGRVGSMVSTLSFVASTYYEGYCWAKNKWGQKGADTFNVGIGVVGLVSSLSLRNYSLEMYYQMANFCLDPSVMVVSTVILASGVLGLILHKEGDMENPVAAMPLTEPIVTEVP